MRGRAVRWVGRLAILAVASGIGAMPAATAAVDDDGRQFRAYIFEGTCTSVVSQPVADIGTLAPDDEAAAARPAAADADPEVVYGGEGHVEPALDTLLSSEHVVAVREDRDGAQPIVACGQIADDAVDVELEPFGDTGIEGRARIETLKRVDETTRVAVGVWEADPTAADARGRQMPEAPDFEIALFDGETVRLSDYRGSTVVMVMWASWCPYCNAEFPMYEEIWRDMRDDGVVFLGIGLKNDDQGDAEDFVEEHGVTFPVGRDTEGGNRLPGEIEATLGVPGTTAQFIDTPDGHVYGAQFGVIERESFEDAIRDASTYRDPS